MTGQKTFWRAAILLIILTMNASSQTDSTRRTWKWEITADYGGSLAENHIDPAWDALSSARFGIGIVPNSAIVGRLFLAYNEMRSLTHWGSMSGVRVFEKEYFRRDVSLYVQVTFLGWFSLGYGYRTESREDMFYRTPLSTGRDTIRQVLRQPSGMQSFAVLGIGPNIPLGSDFYIPLGIYYGDYPIMFATFRLGLSKRF